MRDDDEHWRNDQLAKRLLRRAAELGGEQQPNESNAFESPQTDGEPESNQAASAAVRR
jgi:hypothetical protein